MKKCAGDGCHNTISYMQTLCTGCAMKARQQEAAMALYINDGHKRLCEYLAWWALFESRYGPN